MRHNLKQHSEIMIALENYLDASKYKVYKGSIKHFEGYSIINYQSNSVVDFNISDDNMIYGIGTLMYRMSDCKILEIYCQSNSEAQIRKYLKQVE